MNDIAIAVLCNKNIVEEYAFDLILCNFACNFYKVYITYL